MDTEVVTLWFALATTLGLVGAAALVGVALGAGRGATAAAVSASALPLAALVSVGATAGSLWLSEGAHFVPCVLCWYQRIAMYGLGAILLLAALRRDESVRPYGLVLAGGGALISAYHVLVQRVESVPGASCSIDVPCSVEWVRHLGFVTIPVMAGSCFVLVFVLLAGFDPRRADRESD